MKRSGTKRSVTAHQQLAWLIACACISMPVNADENVGKVTISHLNGGDAQRGMCV
jgi:hypothetical protein